MGRRWPRGRARVLEFRWPPGSTSPESGGSTVDLSRYGRGEFDPETGLYEWYEIPSDVYRQVTGQVITWSEILTRWSLVEADLHETYGLDIGDAELLANRSWRWLRVRLIGLVYGSETRLSRALAPDPSST